MFRDLARNRRGLLLIGAALAVAAFAVVVLLLNKQTTNTATTSLIPTATATLAPGVATSTPLPSATPLLPGQTQVQASKDVPVGLKISDPVTIAQYFTTMPLSGTAVANALTSTDVIVTAVVSNTIEIVKPIRKGTIVTTDAYQLLPFSPPGSLAYQVRAGRVAESVQIGLTASVNGTILPGDFVDILLTLHDKDLSPFTANPPVGPNSGPIQTQQLLPNIRVIDVKPGGLYTLELTPQQSLLMKYLKDYGGAVELVLMSSSDVKTQAALPATHPVVPSYFLTPIASVTGTPQTNGVPYIFSTPVSTPVAGATVTR